LVASNVIIIIGILVSAFYLYYNSGEDREKKHELERDSSNSPPPPPHYEFRFKLQYEQISESMHSRENTTIVGGTILITASVLILSSTLAYMFQKPTDYITRLIVVSAALAIYVVWLLCINLTSNLLDDIGYSKLREMEKMIGQKLEIHTHIRDKWEKRKRFKFLRRHQWLWLLWVLIAFGVAILLLR
jgi:hypothetical protein